MKTITQYLANYLSCAFHSLGYEGYGNVSFSNRPDLCQYQCNDAFQIAKQYKKNPLVIAQDIVEILEKDKTIFQTVNVSKPGYINITLTDEFISNFCIEMFNEPNLGIPVCKHPRTIIIDYGGPNIAKPLHIGHLRSAIIGESLKRLYQHYGDTVISDVHMGDWGLQMGLVIAEYKERYPNWQYFAEPYQCFENDELDINVNELNELYPFASEKSKKNKAFSETAKKITYELQNGNIGYLSLWNKIKSASVLDLKKIYKMLSVDFDYWYGESDAQKYIIPLIDILSKKGLLFESDGALVVDVSNKNDKKPIPPILIKKSDSSSLYATTDLATIIQRKIDFNPQKIMYVVDARQELHFEQVFRCARKAELINAGVELEFLGFGTINGSDGKPYKTRDGGVMKLETFIEIVKSAAIKELHNSNYIKNISDNELNDLALKIAIAAIKYGDLMNHRTKNYIFDSDKFLSFEGKTGTYLLYTITRINSLFKKIGQYNCDYSLSYPFDIEERNLLLNIINTGDVFLKAIDNNAPNVICEHAYIVASSFSRLYQKCNILRESDIKKKNSLINIFMIAKKYLLLYLELLGIEPVEYM